MDAFILPALQAGKENVGVGMQSEAPSP